MLKRSLVVVLALVISSLVWLLFIRGYDLRFKFSVSTLPEIANATLQTWVAAQGDQTKVSVDFDRFLTSHVVNREGTDYDITWQIQAQKDSTVRISASVSSKKNRWTNRVGSLFYETAIKRHGTQIVKDFYDKLEEHLSVVRVQVVGLEAVEPQLCLCIANATTRFGKAFGMMQNFQYLSDGVVDNELTVAGNPLVMINEWNEQDDFIQFDFCFPVEASRPLTSSDFYYKEQASVPAIKAIYNGNYITSDRAWYALQHYARKNKLKTRNNPIEIFYNNPNIENEETTWRADVYLPLVND